MFSFICNYNLVFPNSTKGLLNLNLFNGRRRESSTQITTTSALCFVSIRSRAIFISSTNTSEISTSTSTTDEYDDKSFTVSYLINSCGLSEETALSASKGLELKTTSKPDSVLTLLRDYGFEDTHISNFVQRRPTLLLADPKKTLKPKLDFFNSIGLCGTELAHVISTNPLLLTQSLENHIIPSIAFLKTMVHTDTDFSKMFKRNRWLLDRDPQKKLAPRIALLQAHGVPSSNISKMLIAQPRSFVETSDDQFNDTVKQVREMGFDPLKVAFVHAICILTSISKSVWEGKLDVFRKWGWSDEEIHMAFMKKPHIMALSEKSIMDKMDFFVNKMGYDPSLIAHRPIFLTFSLEKRIIPRFLVLQLLIMKGLVNKDQSLDNVFGTTEDSFMKKFVTKFENEDPGLLNVYRQKNQKPECSSLILSFVFRVKALMPAITCTKAMSIIWTLELNASAVANVSSEFGPFAFSVSVNEIVRIPPLCSRFDAAVCKGC